MNLTHNNLVTVSKTTPEDKRENEIHSQIQELKDLIINNKQSAPQQSGLDISEIVKAISEGINIKVSGGIQQENVVSYKEEERMQEEALRNMIFKKGKEETPKKLGGFGTDKQVESESDGNEDLLGKMGL
jgi:RNA-splicing ligase RtcB